MKKVLIIVLVTVLVLIAAYFIMLVLFSVKDSSYTLEGIIQDVSDTTLMITPTNNNNIGDKVAVHISNVNLSASEKSRLVAGLKIKIKYSGEVMESYPVQIVAQDIEFFN